MRTTPEFPIRVQYTDGSDDEHYDTEEELVGTLEWFDSEDPDYHAVVLDKFCRKVHLVVRKLELEKFDLK